MSPSRKSVPSAIVGVDIGSDSIKVAEARFAKDGITITGLGIAKTPEGTIANEVIVDPKTLGSAVKALLAESGIKTKKCVSSVAGQSNVVVRVIEVPKMKPEELAETMRWEIERHVPFAAQEVEYDFHALDRPGADPDAQEMEVLLAVAQQDLVNSHIETLFAAGLQPVAIDVEPLAASRSLIETQNGTHDDVTAIVNIGANVTDVGIFEGGLLTFPSPPIAIAGVNFTREIAEAFGQTLDQAEITKKEYAAADAAVLDTMYQQAPAADEPDQPQADADEPTQFNTIFAQPQDDEADTAPPAEPADASQYGAFTETVDGPVFDMSGDSMGSAPDLGGAAPPSGPVFDLGETGVAAEPSGPAFDLGEPSQPEPSGPAFDLGDTGSADDEGVFDIGGETAAAEPMTPDFDLEDVEPIQPVAAAPPAFDLGDVSAQPVYTQPDDQPRQGALPPDASSTEHQVAQAISAVLLELANDLRRSLEYYSTRYSKMPSRVFLCGGTAKMPKLDEFLSRELGVPVVVADPLKDIRVNVPAASPQYLKEIAPLLPVSIGLAIRDMIG